MHNIVIENFQSHQKTELNLSDGINVFSGNSDCGKSAIMRALLWCIENKPSGDAYVRNAIKDNKGKIKGTCSVSIDGITRVRNKDFNGYKTEVGSTYEALRTDVPTPIQDELGIGSVNIQRQLDGPFMLSNTPGENAKYINSLVNLDVIDKSASWIGAKIRNNNSELMARNSELEELHKQSIDENILSELEYVATTINELSKVQTEVESYISRLEDDINQYESVKSKLSKFNSLDSLNQLVNNIDALTIKADNLVGEFSDLGNKIDIFNKLSNGKNWSLFAEFENIINELSVLNKSEMGKEFHILNEEIGGYWKCKHSLMMLEPAIDHINEELGRMPCPLCGRYKCKDDLR